MQKVTVDFDVSALMRDGVTLRANVYRPEGSGPWPTLLARTPYGKDAHFSGYWLEPVQACRCGFMVVIQDVRGRFASEGDFDPFRSEGQDGYDTVEWAARLPGSNGRVGMFGLSYLGNTQWQAAIAQPPSLSAIAPALTWSNPMDGLLTRGGALELGVAAHWSLQQSFDYLARLQTDDAEIQRRVDAVTNDLDLLVRHGYWQLPVDDIPVLRPHNIPGLGSGRSLVHPDGVEWTAVSDHHDQIVVPSFNIGGWHDLFLQGTLDNYQAMVARGIETRLIVGPWTHLTFGDPIGEQLFGMRASRQGVRIHRNGDVNDLWLRWLRSHLVPEPRAELRDAPVRIFVMGKNEWRDESDWPLQRARTELWFLNSSGSLSLAQPVSNEHLSEFLYDPMDPVPTLGGPTLLAPGFSAGPVDQTKVEARGDVLVFSSEPLEEDIEVTGRVRIVIHAESSEPSTDWVARLCDVHPDGRSLNLCDGILRVTTGAQECRRYEIDLWSTSNVFLRGHRLRVHVTSSSFPRWDRNLNTGKQQESRHVVARQRIYHDAERPSFIELPIVR